MCPCVHGVPPFYPVGTLICSVTHSVHRKSSLKKLRELDPLILNMHRKYRAQCKLPHAKSTGRYGRALCTRTEVVCEQKNRLRPCFILAKNTLRLWRRVFRDELIKNRVFFSQYYAYVRTAIPYEILIICVPRIVESQSTQNSNMIAFTLLAGTFYATEDNESVFTYFEIRIRHN
jgi:hypothetical protein